LFYVLLIEDIEAVLRAVVEEIMGWAKAVLALGMMGLFATAAMAQGTKSQDAIVIVFKDGHQQSIPMSSIARIEFKSSPATAASAGAASGASALGLNHFVGKWEVGEGSGRSTFFITLNRDGTASKTIGAAHGTWAVVDGEAQVTWDDGWHDAIRKVGSKHQKYAYGPGKTFSDEPDNVTEAKNTEPSPI
jgi:hypothetical protein